jgi:hypothetical protein
MSIDEAQHTLNLNIIGNDIDALAKQAYNELIAQIGNGKEAASVTIARVLKNYSADVQAAVDTMMREYLSLGTPNSEPLATVGNIALSEALYANANLVVAPVVARLINESTQQLKTARELSRLIYDGYDFQDDPLKVKKELPKYLIGNLQKAIKQASLLKTPSVKAAYLQALGKIEKGAHQDALNKALQVAFYERNRYLANRIAQTELHRVHTDTIAADFMADETLHWVKVSMSSTHPQYDICDYHSKLNAYGKGAGIYPKAKAPKPPYHPHCRCRLMGKHGIDAPEKPPLENLSAAREMIAKLPKSDAIAILGSEAKYFEYRQSKSLSVLDIVDRGKPLGYGTKVVGDVKPAIMVGMKTEINFAPRTTWNKDFPRVIFASVLGSAEKHKDYVAAKAGDILAASRLVNDLVTDDVIQRVSVTLKGLKPTIVPVLAIESTGNNMIPNAYANKIAAELGLDVSYNIIQSEKVGRTGKGSDYRLAYAPKFDGIVVKSSYLIIDDTMTIGGTLANLKGYIETNGGNVIGATTLTGFGSDGILALSDKMRENLWKKHGKELDDYLKEQFGYGIDSLTQGEAGHYRKASTVDEIRTRITAARNEKGRSGR